jgi:acetylornithine deacetylase/succinyl-diaminopimelate desuccinylase-like protein
MYRAHRYQAHHARHKLNTYSTLYTDLTFRTPRTSPLHRTRTPLTHTLTCHSLLAQALEQLVNTSFRPTYCLVGEPSSTSTVGDCIRVGRRGSHAVELTLHGTLGHTAYPHLVVNPAHAMVRVLHDLESHQWCTGTDHFPPSSFAISGVNAYTGVFNVTPATCTAAFDIRYSPRLTAEDIERFVTASIKVGFPGWCA